MSTTAAGALTLVAFAVAADRALNLYIPPYHATWQGGLAAIVERCLPLLRAA